MLLFLIVLLGCDISGLRRDGFTRHDGEYVCYDSSFVVGDSTIKLDADPETFEILEREGYAKDSKNVWWQSHVVEDADAASLELSPPPTMIEENVFSSRSS